MSRKQTEAFFGDLIVDMYGEPAARPNPVRTGAITRLQRMFPQTDIEHITAIYDMVQGEIDDAIAALRSLGQPMAENN